MMLRSSTGLLVALAAPWLGAATLRVPEDHAGIQAAIDAAADGDEVLVAPGEYVIVRPIVLGADKAVALRSREGPERTTIRMSETPEDPHRASVVIFEESPPGTVVEGFTITGGQSTWIQRNSRPSWGSYGGGVLARGGSPLLSRCVVSRNRAPTGGGVSGVPITILDCRIVNNHASLWGAGLAVSGRVERTTIAGNSGGGVVAGIADFRACRIAGNSGTQGAGVHVAGGSFKAWNCIIAGNSAILGTDGYGGLGGGLLVGRGEAVFTNCTIAGNTAAVRGGGIDAPYEAGGFLTLRNCIVWGNGGGDLRIYGDRFGSNVSVTHSNLTGSLPFVDRPFPGQGNLNADPQFVLPGLFDFSSYETVTIGGEEVRLPDFIIDEGDYRLRPDSPLIDRGGLADGPPSDIDGNPRPCGGGVDIGAHEQGGCAERTIFFRRGDANADGTLSLTDAVFLLVHLFRGGPAPGCAVAADIDDSGALDLADPVYLLNRLFRSGPPLPPPRGECGLDPTPGALGCEEYAPCGVARL